MPLDMRKTVSVLEIRADHLQVLLELDVMKKGLLNHECS